MIRAILRAQILSLRLRVRAHDRGAIFSAVTSLAFYGFWAFAAWGASEFFADPANFRLFQEVLPSGLLLVMLYWQLAPVISASMGSSLELRKLLVYPIPPRTLFAAEVLLRITSLAEMPLVVMGVASGLARNPRIGLAAWPLIFGGALIFIAMNVVLAAGVRHTIERLFLRTRLREVLLLIFALVGVLPQLLLMTNIRRATLMRFVPARMVWPWAAAAKLMLGRSVALAAPVALAYLAVFGWFGWWQFGRALHYDAAGSPKRERETRAAGIGESLVRLPAKFLRDPLAALLEKELRTFARIARFRFVYGMSCVFGLVLYLPWIRRADHASFMFANALPAMSLYGLLMLGQISYWNSFGFDRSAVQGYFSWPIRFRDALVAKNIAVGVLVVPQVLAITLVARMVCLPVSPGKVLETAAVALIAAVYWCTVGNAVSVRMPRPLDPDKLNQMSNRLQMLSILASPLLLLPIGLAYWARAVFDSQLVFVLLLALAATIGGAFYYVGLDSSAERAIRGRESMVRLLSQGEGPFSTS